MASVKDIERQCNKLLTVAENEDRLDVHMSVSNLKEKLNTMVYEYENKSYDEVAIGALKDKCEEAAITLEYALSHTCLEQRQKYADRVMIADMFMSIFNRLRKQKANCDCNELALALICYKELEKLLERSKHIDFELTSEDKELINQIEQTESELKIAE